MYHAQKQGLNRQLKKLSKLTLKGLAQFMSLQSVQRWSANPCLLPFYHLVGDSEELPHVKHLYAIRDEKLFEQDLDTILAIYEPIELSQLIDIQHNGSSLSSKPYFHLSFDDGLRACYDVIAPILLRKGIPATFFVNSAFIDNKALMFRYKASLLIDFILKQPAVQPIVLNKYGARGEKLLLVKHNESNQLDELALALGFDFDAFLLQQKPYMSLEHLKTLIQKGFTIGSHSIDHPLYKSIDLTEQLRQTEESQSFLNKELELSYQVFAFPFTDDGVNLAFFDEILKSAKFDLTFGGAGLKKDIVSRNLQRFPMETQSLDAAKDQLLVEYLYAFLRKLFGKGVIRRI